MRRYVSAMVGMLILVFPLLAAGVDKDNLKEYGRGIIEDYSDMTATDEIEWIWIAPEFRLHDCKFEVKSTENITALTDDDMEEIFAENLPKSLTRAGSKDETAPLVRVDAAIYWAQRANRSKWWIPYAGAHLAQAGAGIELVFRNDKDEIVCKMRHSGREGDDLENAIEELVDEVARYVRAH